MIRVEQLNKNYGSIQAVQDLNLEARKGEVLGLLGPNGAGKTSTLRIITGYLTPSSGRVLIKGINIEDDPVRAKSLLGYLPESAPLAGEMLAFDYLQYIGEIRKLNKETVSTRIQKLSSQCGIRSIMHRPIRTLSKGFRQRVGLCAALMGDPEILILDEPASGLDPNQIREIRKLIRQIGEEKTVILSTHILSEAEAVCDRVVIINNGRLAAEGTTEMLREQASGQTLQLELKGGTIEEYRTELLNLEKVNSLVVNKQKGNSGALLQVRTQGDIREEIYAAIKNKNWSLLEMYRQQKTLEHIFQDLTLDQTREVRK